MTVINKDCSCNVSCLFEGYCCDDFHTLWKMDISKADCENCKNCINGIRHECKNNSYLSEYKCICDQGFKFDVIQDECVSQVRNSESKINTHGPSNEVNPLVDIPDILSTFLPANSKGTVGFKRNFTLNVYRNNKNLKLITKNEKNLDSHNSKSNVVENIGSKNVIRGDNMLKKLDFDLDLDFVNNIFHSINKSNKTSHTINKIPIPIAKSQPVSNIKANFTSLLKTNQLITSYRIKPK